MKKIKVLLIIIISIFTLIPTMGVNAETLKDYKNLLNKYKKEMSNNQASINEANAGLNSANKEIESIKNELVAMGKEIEKMKEDIVSYNNEIKDKSLETKKLFEYLQIAQKENLYLEYALDAKTMTDLVYRISVIKQLAEYNKNTIENLENMIKNNQNREVELNKKEVSMNDRTKELNNKITKLTGVKASLNKTNVSVKQQIQIYQDLIKSYEAAGCKDNDVIGKDCAKTNNVAGWFRPVDYGYVTSEFGYRWGDLHNGLDISNRDPYNTKVYPVANGRISAIYTDYYGAKCVVIEHKTYQNKYYTSIYCHLKNYSPNIYVGKSVGIYDYVGYMGNTGWTTGPHLHLEIAPCRVFNQSDANCGRWNNYTSYLKKIYNNGSYKGPRDLLYFPKTWTSFSGRS